MFGLGKKKRGFGRGSAEREEVFRELEARAAERRRREERRMAHAGEIYRWPDEEKRRPMRTDVPGFIARPPEEYIDEQPAEPTAAKLPSELRIEGVKVVPRGKYSGCEELVSVYIGPEVEVIEDDAFEKCPNLQNVEFSEGLKMIGSGAFADCPQLGNFKLPSTLESLCIVSEQKDESGEIKLPTLKRGNRFGIYKGAFSNCKSITHVEIPEGVRVIPESTFAKCFHLKSVVLPPDICIEAMAFAKCKRLEAVDFSRGVRLIGMEAFLGCVKIKNIALPGAVDVGARAFMDCTGLESLSVSREAVFDVGVFENCANLQKVEYPAENGLSLGTFRNCPVNRKVLMDILRRMMPGLPEAAKPEDFIDVQKMVIPEGVTEIKDEAFAHHPSLEELELPKSLREIGKGAFRCSEKLYRVRFSRGLVRIGDASFQNCGLEFLDFPEGLEEIGNYAFYHNPAKHVNFPNSLKYIGNEAFRNTCLEHLMLNDGIVYIGAKAFANSDLKIAVLPNDLCTIAEKTFYGCGSLAQVHMPAVLKTIDTSAFEGCKLRRIQIPDGIRNIEALAFGDCKYLKEVELPKGIRCVDSTAFVGTSLERLDYPNSVVMEEKEKRCFDGRIAEAMRMKRCELRYDGYAYDEDSVCRQAQLCGYPPVISVPKHLAHMKNQFPDAVEFEVREPAAEEEA